jgi:hypothetical protein
MLTSSISSVRPILSFLAVSQSSMLAFLIGVRLGVGQEFDITLYLRKLGINIYFCIFEVPLFQIDCSCCWKPNSMQFFSWTSSSGDLRAPLFTSFSLPFLLTIGTQWFFAPYSCWVWWDLYAGYWFCLSRRDFVCFLELQSSTYISIHFFQWNNRWDRKMGLPVIDDDLVIFL